MPNRGLFTKHSGYVVPPNAEKCNCQLEQEGDHYFMTQPGFLWGLFPGFVRLLCTAGAAVLPDNFWLVARYQSRKLQVLRS